MHFFTCRLNSMCEFNINSKNYVLFQIIIIHLKVYVLLFLASQNHLYIYNLSLYLVVWNLNDDGGGGSG